MSYEKQTWTNNVSSIDETKMNHIEDGIEGVDLKIDNIAGTKGTIIPTATAELTRDITLTTADTNVDIPLELLSKNNSSFTLSGGGIVCPFSGNIMVTTSVALSPRRGYATITVLKNGATQCDVACPSGTQNYGVIETANRMFAVSAGDVITIKVKSSSANDIVKQSIRSRLTIFYVNTD